MAVEPANVFDLFAFTFFLATPRRKFHQTDRVCWRKISTTQAKLIFILQHTIHYSFHGFLYPILFAPLSPPSS